MTASAAEVIIVGAGPAGSTAALLLARAGHDVLVIDRREFPRPKACGDCLSAGATAVLHRLGVLAGIERLPHARLSGWRIVAPDGTAFDGHFAAGGGPAHALSVERYLLDAALLETAVRAGARFTGGVRVNDLVREPDGRVAGVRTRDAVLRGRIVIGADGLRSVVARAVGAVRRPPRLRKASLTLHIDFPAAAPDTGEMHTGDGTCAGLAPLRADASRCNLTVVADASRFGRDIAADRHAFVAAAIDRLPALRGRVPAVLLREARILASGPFDRPVRRAHFHGGALVGDAAGYYDPFTGQGVFQALAGAELLAGVIDAALRSGDAAPAALAGWEAERRRLTRGPRLVQHLIEAVLARPRLASLAIRRIRAAQHFADTIIAVTGDIAPARRLLAPRALLSLLNPA
jgi:menaquinone-9 beta-reductase